MKVGDKVPVTIAGQQVTLAVVTEMGDGTATLVFPATKAVMGVRTELDTTPVAPQGNEHAILGVEPATQPTLEAPSVDVVAEVAPAPVAATPAVEQNAPTGEQSVPAVAEVPAPATVEPVSEPAVTSATPVEASE